MARRTCRPQPTKTLTLPTLTTHCVACGHSTPANYRRHRTLTTLGGVIRLQLQVRRCGSVRILAATATRLRAVRGADLAPTNLNTWRSVRRALEQRRLARTLGRRFRRDPRAYLRGLERGLAAKSGLPA